MLNLEVADERLREIVDGYGQKGLPITVLAKIAKASLTEEQDELMGSLMELGEQEQKFGRQKPKKGSDHWNHRETIRKKIQGAILLGLDHLGIVQRQAVGYGAIPDPEEDWKYYRQHDGVYACWICGTEILAKETRCSVHFAERPLAGSGEVRRIITPYCPKCEKEPADTGIITETVEESIQRDMR